jgi:hypothetical protein
MLFSDSFSLKKDTVLKRLVTGTNENKRRNEIFRRNQVRSIY